MGVLFGERRDVTAFNVGSMLTARAKSGAVVDESTVLGLDTFAACLGLMCDVVTMLPVRTYRDAAGVPAVVNSPQLVSGPSLRVDAPMWRAQAVVSWFTHGNAYGLVLSRDRFGFPAVVEWLDPNTVGVEENSQLAKPVFRVGGTVVADTDFLHVPGRWVRPGSALGVAPLERFRETFGLALAARDFGANWFGGGGIPNAILRTDQPVSQDQAATIKDRFMSAMKGKREPVVMGLGVEYQQVQVAPGESQFAETMSASSLSVARACGMPPEMVGAAVSGSSVTYANREQRVLDFLTFSADPWLVRLENLLTNNIASPLYAQFVRGALLRSDLLTRYRAHDMAIRGGFATVNERRDLEDWGPLPSGDEALWPPYTTTPIVESSK